PHRGQGASSGHGSFRSPRNRDLSRRSAREPLRAYAVSPQRVFGQYAQEMPPWIAPGALNMNVPGPATTRPAVFVGGSASAPCSEHVEQSGIDLVSGLVRHPMARAAPPPGAWCARRSVSGAGFEPATFGL